ncbi:DNA-binding protein D-ETS-4 [Ixodes scapularis]
MLRSAVPPRYPAVDTSQQLVPSPSHSGGAASPVSMADQWGMNELGVWFDDSDTKIKQEPQSAPSSPQSSCMMGGGGMLDYPAVLEELVNVTKNCGLPAQRAPVGQPSSPSMYDEPCSGSVRYVVSKNSPVLVDKCRPPPPSYPQRVTVKTEDCSQSYCCGSLSADKLDQLRVLAVQQATKDIDVACQILNISPDPYHWSVNNVHSWLVWTQQQYGCPAIKPEYFNMDGSALCTLSEDDFRMRAPGSGDILSAQLEIWKSAAHLRPPEHGQRSPQQFCPEDSVLDLAGLLGQTISGSGADPSSAVQHSVPLNLSDNHSDGLHSDDEASDASSDLADRCVHGLVAGSGGGPRTPSSSHIHLWQFLKELLSQPQLYGSCIRWLDRTRGVFKIEDSVRVARLWGKRKNRPAMNYDKLSRSIRQYYKKGIMKKTERSQRLVYQFCAPYSC